jgi:hypothetical protein
VVRLTYTRSDWLAIAQELAANDRAKAPPGLIERIRALLHQVPGDWTGEPCALELDPAGAEIVRAVQARLDDRGRAGDGGAAVSAAEALLRDHHEFGQGYEQVWIGKGADAGEIQRLANRLLVDLGRRGGTVLQTHFVATPLAVGGVEYGLCLVYQEGASVAGQLELPDLPTAPSGA